jgi:LysM repeat protein
MSLILFCIRSRVFLLGLSLLGVLPVLQANVQIANLKQDLELIAREVAGLRTEVELLRRENAQLRVVLNQVSDGASSRRDDSQDVLVQVNARVRKLEARISWNESNTVKLQNTFDEKIRELIKQMNKNFEKVASAPASPVTPSFSSDYPQNGFVHKVEKGETVSSIASKYKSKVKWIIDANQIADPTKVFIGKELFVPQK